VSESQAACLARFLAAVRAARRNDYEPAKAIVAAVEAKAGAEAGERAKKEIWNYIRSGKQA
jgi:hypothetical protein